MGYVQGIHQSSDRAELLAVLSDIQWQCHFGTIMHLQCGLTQSLWPMAFPVFFSLGDRRLVSSRPMGKGSSVAATTWTV